MGAPLRGMETRRGLPTGTLRTTGAALPPKLVEAARSEEIRFMQSWQVCEVRPIAECRERTGKNPIGGRWLDHNKGD
eukprot:2873220-Alexandrium_andersonii.AAC.1